MKHISLSEKILANAVKPLTFLALKSRLSAVNWIEYTNIFQCTLFNKLRTYIEYVINMCLLNST